MRPPAFEQQQDNNMASACESRADCEVSENVTDVTETNTIQHELDDDDLRRLQKDFISTTSGRGRPKNILIKDLKNKLLLQLHILHTNYGCTWASITDWLHKRIPIFPSNKWRYAIESTWSAANKLSTKEAIVEFVSSSYDVETIGLYCSAAGITRTYLLEPIPACDSSCLTLGVLFELASNITNVPETIDLLCPNIFSRKFISKKVKQVRIQHTKLIKKTSRWKEIEELLSTPLMEVQQPPPQLMEVQQPPPQPMEMQQPPPTEPDYKERCQILDVTLDTLNAHCKALFDEKGIIEAHLQEKCSVLKKTIDESDELKENLLYLETKLKNVSEELSDIKKGQLHKKNVRRRKYLNEKTRLLTKKENKVRSILKNVDDSNRLKCQLRKTKQLLLTCRSRAAKYLNKLCDSKKEVDKLKAKMNVYEKLCDRANDDLSRLKVQYDDLDKEMCDLNILSNETATRVGGTRTRFTDTVEACVMELVGELDVPTTKCSQIIQCVGKWLFKTNIPLSELPSSSTCNNILDRAHFLSKYQVGEELSQSNKWDLHGDGTTRDHVKIIGQQITLDCGKTLSTGFINVHTEDSNTLLDNAISLLEELSEIFSEQEKEVVYKEMLGKLFASMTDRASVNKLFNEKLSEHRKTILGQPSDLHYLHCNAHFLLGLSNKAEQVLKKEVKRLEEEMEFKFGRDAYDKFRRFQSASESGPGRFVRTCCDCLGPRGDEKSGCRLEWESHCSKNGFKSLITSFRANRFNNFFQGAASLYYHQSEIASFLGKKDSRNLKLESVYLDVISKELMAFVRALGIVYVKVTGPYWKLMESNVNYCDLYVYIQQMNKCFQTWSINANAMLDASTVCLPGFELSPTEVSNYVINCDDNTAFTVDILQALMKGFLDVVEHQLNDFLPGGKYGEEPSTELRESMAHCKLTNLVSEHEFGHLDFSQFRRRHASLYFHSGVQMVKRNNTISEWLAKKSPSEQANLLCLGRNKSIEYRQKYRKYQEKVAESLSKKLEDSERRIKEKEAKKTAHKNLIIENVSKQGGPCRSVDDLKLLVSSCSSDAKKKELLKNEMRYIKVVLGVKHQKLVFGTKSVDELFNDLGEILNCSVVPNVNVMPEKKQEMSNVGLPTFKFTRQGEWVAVAYESDYFIGTVMNVDSDDKATVQFLTRGINNVFKWPRVDDIAQIESKFIFAHAFEVTTRSGRSWHVTDIQYVELLFKQYQALFFVECDL